MKNSLAFFLAFGLVTLNQGSLMAQRGGSRGGDPDAAKHGWLLNLEDGKAQAKKSGKPLMVVFRCAP